MFRATTLRFEYDFQGPGGVELLRRTRTKETQRRLRELEQLELVFAYRAGASVYRLADRIRIARQTVSAVLERHGVRVDTGEQSRRDGRTTKPDPGIFLGP